MYQQNDAAEFLGAFSYFAYLDTPVVYHTIIKLIKKTTEHLFSCLEEALREGVPKLKGDKGKDGEPLREEECKFLTCCTSVIPR